MRRASGSTWPGDRAVYNPEVPRADGFVAVSAVLRVTTPSCRCIDSVQVRGNYILRVLK